MRYEQTLLFVPADRPERFEKAFASGADGVILDLEDAVAPSRKEIARMEMVRCLRQPPPHRIYVRINGSGTQWHQDDLSAIRTVFPAGMMLPKAVSRTQIDAVAESVGNQLPLIALVETAQGIVRLEEIANHPAVFRLAFGSIDFQAEIGLDDSPEPLLFARSQIVLHSRAADLFPPLDGVTTVTDDREMILETSVYARKLGFGGKLCIHPKQIVPTRSGFLPSSQEIEWAREICEAVNVDAGAVSVSGKMVDAPVLARARCIMSLLSEGGRASCADGTLDITRG